MVGTSVAKRKADEIKLRSQPNKRFKRQTYYSSGSSDSENEVSGSAASAPKVSATRDKRRIPPNTKGDDGGDVGDGDGDGDGSLSLDTRDHNTDATHTTSASDGSASDSDADSSSASVSSPSDSGAHTKRKLTKRHDPSAFASAISAILDSKAGKAKDPILARSKAAAEAAHSHAEARLEARAKRKLRDEKRTAADKGRVRDVLLGDRRRTPGLSESEAEESGAGDASRVKSTKKVKSGGDATKLGGSSARHGISAAEIAEQERKLRKTAQRGVVKLFNAVRAAQVKAEETAREIKQKGIVGVKQREEAVGEMGRQAFLDLVGAGKMDTT